MKTVPISEEVHAEMKQHLAKVTARHKTIQSFIDAAVRHALRKR